MGNTPKLRFEGFTGNWELHKVGDYYDFKNGLNKDKKYFGEGTPIVNFTDVFHNRGLLSSNLKGRVRLTPEEIRNYEVKQGDLFFTRTSETIGEIGYPSVMLDRPEDTVFSGFVLRGRSIQHDDPLDDLFKKYTFFTNAFRNEMIRKSSMTTRALTTGSSIKDMAFRHPSSKAEQRLIGKYLTLIENTISLHQRKHETLAKAKQFYLQVMFPQNGERVPKLRFAGFSGDWERSKLGRLVQFSKGAGYSKADLQTSGTPIILYGRLYTQYETIISDVDTFAEAKQGSVYSRGGEVIVPASGETAEDIAIASVVERPGLILGGDLNVITPTSDLDSVFLAISISKGTPHFEIAKMAQGKSIVHLHNSDLEKAELTYPNYFEQAQISGFFRQLETLITLLQCKITALQTIKHFFLQNMFV